MMPETFSFWLTVFLYLWISSSEQAKGTSFETKKTSCPDVCICKNDRVKCVNKSLDVIPSNLPKTTVYLDISKNKHIHIPDSKFSNLRYLLVRECELERHFDLPKKLMNIDISHNKLSLQEFLLMFSKSSKFLTSIDAYQNHIEIKRRISILGNASSVIKLTLGRGNHMPILYKETFKGLRNLRSLKIPAMAIEQIEDNAFEDLAKLKELDGSGNKLISFPPTLFKPLKNLAELDLSECQLRNFPNLTGLPKNVFRIYLRRNNIENISGIEYMGIKFIFRFILAHNHIRELPSNVFQQIAAYSIDLSYNKLQTIEPYSFTGCNGFLSFLIICYNNLTDISAGAFRGLTSLNALYLFANKIGTVHMNTFKNMTIKDLYLFNNNSISHLPDIWTPMKKPPSKVLLFNNPLTHFSGVTVGGIEIFLSCNILQKLSGPIHLNSSISCLPSESFTFQLPKGHGSKEFAANSGFVCPPCRRPFQSTCKCKPCPPGYFLAQEEKSCSKCPPGAFYQDLVAQLQCKRCPLGQYVPPDNASGKSPLECKTCPEGTRTNESAGYRACHCLIGFSRKDRFSGCVRCETKGIKCEGDYQTLAPNFWWSWDYSIACLKKYLAFVDNLKTENNNYNRNSRSFDCPMPKAHKCVSNGICLGGIRTKCRKGYTGPLCALCQRGHYKHFKSCAKCSKLWIVCFQLLGYILLFIFLCVLVNWADKLIVNLSNDEERSLADVLLSLLKILLGFYQVLIGTVTSFSYIPWPKTLNTALKVFKYIELELLRMPSLRCVKYSWEVNAITEFWISLFLTVLVPCAIFVYYVIRIRILHKHCRTRQEFLSKSKSSKESCFRSTMIFFFSSYPITSKRIIQLLPFSCHNICFDSTSKHCLSFIKADYSLKCLPSNEGHWLLYVVYVSTIIPFGFPVLLLLRLYLTFRVRKHQKPKVIDGYVAINADEKDLGENNAHIYRLDENENKQAKEDTISNNTATHLSFRFLYENYKPSCWYWEVIEMYRKLFLTAVLPILASESNILLAVTIILSSLFAVLHAYAKPIKNNFENYLQLVSLTVIPINLCIGYMLETMATENAVTTSQAKGHLGIGMLLLILNSFLILAMLARLIEVQIKKMKLLLNGGQCSCRCCIACILPCVSGRSTVLIY